MSDLCTSGVLEGSCRGEFAEPGRARQLSLQTLEARVPLEGFTAVLPVSRTPERPAEHTPKGVGELPWGSLSPSAGLCPLRLSGALCLCTPSSLS